MKNKLESVFEGALWNSRLIGLALYLSHVGEHPSPLKKLPDKSEPH